MYDLIFRSTCMFFAISSSEFQEACALAQSDRISTFANPETINQFIEDKGLYPCHLCCQSSSAVSFITIREHSHMTSDVFGSFLTYLPTLIRYRQMWLDLPTHRSDLRF